MSFRTSRTKIKICCIADESEARLAVEHGADAIGLVGPMPSGPGPISDDSARMIAALTLPPVSPFLLTSRDSADRIADHVKNVGVPVVQIVSHVDVPVLRELAVSLAQVKRVQVVHIEDESCFDRLEAYEPFVHAFLLDSGKTAASVPELGGTGRVHDWNLSAEFVRRTDRPVFLAGGLTPDNVARAIEQVRPYGVDLCTGVRTDGRLDAEKLSLFVQQVTSADRALGR